jgi:hypothetical protein
MDDWWEVLVRGKPTCWLRHGRTVLAASGVMFAALTVGVEAAGRRGHAFPLWLALIGWLVVAALAAAGTVLWWVNGRLPDVSREAARRAGEVDRIASRVVWGLMGAAAYPLFVVGVFGAAGGPCASAREASGDACVFVGGAGAVAVVVGLVAAFALARRAAAWAGVVYGAGAACTVWYVVDSAGYFDSRYPSGGSLSLLATGVVGAAGMTLAVKRGPGPARAADDELSPRRGTSLMARGCWVVGISVVAAAVMAVAGAVWPVTWLGIVAGVVVVLAGWSLGDTNQEAGDGRHGRAGGSRGRAVTRRIASLVVGVPATLTAGFLIVLLVASASFETSGSALELTPVVGALLVVLNVVIARVAPVWGIVVYAIAAATAVTLPHLSPGRDIVYWAWALGVVGLLGTALGVRPLRAPEPKGREGGSEWLPSTNPDE